MKPEPDLTTVARLIDDLENEDAFERRDAIESLARLTRHHHDFPWRGRESDRAESVRKWRKWLKRERRRRRGAVVEKSILASGAIDASQLKQLLQGLPTSEQHAVFAAMIKKIGLLGPAGSAAAAALSAAMSGAGPGGPAAGSLAGAHGTAVRCQMCEKRIATARVTARADDGSWCQRAACETCVARLSWG